MTYKPRLPLMKHQLACLQAIANKPTVPCPEDVFALLMDMGVGKSAVVLAEFGEMATNGGPKDLLVIAPKGSIRNWYLDKSDNPDNWSELRKHCDPDFRERLIDHTWIGNGVAWQNKMDRLLDAGKDKKRPRALFVNVEALSTSEECLKLCLDFAGRGAHVVVDESTMIKSNSNRTDAVIKIGEAAESRRILSGLWTPNSPLDLYWQCMFLDERIINQRNHHPSRYATMIQQTNYTTGRKYHQITGYQNLEELQQRVAKYSYRVLKKDCLDLKPKVYVPRDVGIRHRSKRRCS